MNHAMYPSATACTLTLLHTSHGWALSFYSTSSPAGSIPKLSLARTHTHIRLGQAFHGHFEFVAPRRSSPPSLDRQDQRSTISTWLSICADLGWCQAAKDSLTRVQCKNETCNPSTRMRRSNVRHAISSVLHYGSFPQVGMQSLLRLQLLRGQHAAKPLLLQIPGLGRGHQKRSLQLQPLNSTVSKVLLKLAKPVSPALHGASSPTPLAPSRGARGLGTGGMVRARAQAHAQPLPLLSHFLPSSSCMFSVGGLRREWRSVLQLTRLTRHS